MMASSNGHHEVIRTLLEGGADVNFKDEVRNQIIVMIMMIIIVLNMMM